MTELYHWDFTDLNVTTNQAWSEYNTSVFSYMYLTKTSNPKQTGNYDSQGYISEGADYS